MFFNCFLSFLLQIYLRMQCRIVSKFISPCDDTETIGTVYPLYKEQTFVTQTRDKGAYGHMFWTLYMSWLSLHIPFHLFLPDNFPGRLTCIWYTSKHLQPPVSCLVHSVADTVRRLKGERRMISEHMFFRFFPGWLISGWLHASSVGHSSCHRACSVPLFFAF